MQYELTEAEAMTILSVLIVNAGLARATDQLSRENELTALAHKMAEQSILHAMETKGLPTIEDPTALRHELPNMFRLTVRDSSPDGRSGKVLAEHTIRRNTPITIACGGLQSISLSVD